MGRRSWSTSGCIWDSDAPQHIKLGYELTLGDRQVIGGVDVANTPGLASGRAPIEGGAWYVLPLGAYLELYPSQHLGLFLGLHGGAGTFFAPEYMSQGNIHLAGSAAVELGYDLPLWDQSHGAVVLRYSTTGFRGHLHRRTLQRRARLERSLARCMSQPVLIELGAAPFVAAPDDHDPTVFL